MRYPLHTSAQIRAIDAFTIDQLGVPGLALMEIAGRAVAAEIAARLPAEAARGVLVAAGRGNNGGDGYVIARHLHLAGVPVRVLGMSGDHSPDCAVNRAAAEALGIPVSESLPLGGAGLVVDALLGTGLSDDLRGSALERVRAIIDSGLPVVAVDVPTGLCGDSGRVLGAAPAAALTVTFERARTGQLLEPGADLVGALVVAQIGLAADAALARDPELAPVAWIADGPEIAGWLPRRAAASHKHRHGHLGVIAGSREMAGAAALVCNAAIRAGCGLVSLVCGPEVVPRLGALRPEVMVRVARPSPTLLAGFDALAVGPGLGPGPEVEATVRALWEGFEGPAVFDADALTALAGAWRPSDHPRAVTPHPGEAGRLLGRSGAEVQADRLGAVRALAAVAPALLKGRNTLVAAGGPAWLNPTGTPALATAGSGDVLTGLVGALLARGLVPERALAAGAFVHGLAGELAGPWLVAGDLIEALPRAFEALPRRRDVLAVRPLLGAAGQ